MSVADLFTYSCRCQKRSRVFLILTCLVTGECNAGTLFVAKSGDGSTGASWDTAFQSIGQAVGTAMTGDEIWVRGDTYTEALDVGKKLALLGGFSGNEAEDERDLRNWRLNETVIDRGGTDGVTVIIRETVVCDGFTLTGARHAKGLVVYQCDAAIRNCTIRDNSGAIGAGGYVESATVDFTNCTFSNNTADRDGGGLFIGFGSSVIIDSCTVENNTSLLTAGVECGVASLILRNSIIRSNKTLGEESKGGGLVLDRTSTCENCLIYDNTLPGGFGAQIYCYQGGEKEFSNCTVIGDSGDIGWQGVAPFFNSCILWGSPGLLSGPNPADVSYSCLQGGYPGLGNISDDPKFKDAAHGDFHLLPDSPCIDTAGTSGPNDDLDGKPRPIDIAGVGREGADAFDMGAYEFQFSDFPTPTPAPTPTMNPNSDIDQSGKVDAEDLFILIADWTRTATQ